jgi:hypothetical protein
MEQIHQVLSAEHVKQYLFQISIQLLMENGVDEINNLKVDPALIKGLNRGVLLFVNELIGE